MTGAYNWLLRKTILFLAALVALGSIADGQEAPPDASEQAAIIGKMRAYAGSYASSIPNFICTQITTHYSSNPKKDRWKKGDIETAQLAFNGGEERRTVQSINGKAVRSSRAYALNTKGEFVDKLVTAFRISSDAHFEWKGWETIDGLREAVFNFTVDQQHSTKELISGKKNAFVSYQGSVWGNPNSGEVLRISDSSSEIPVAFQTIEIGTTVEYAPITVGSVKYLLPVHASTLQRTFLKNIRNDIDFREYRKFESESTIHFDAPPPNP